MCGNGAEDENRRKKRKRSQLKDKVQRFTFAENSEITRVSVIAQDRYFKKGVSICTADQPDAIDHEAFKDAVKNEMRAPHPIIVIVEGFRAFQQDRTGHTNFLCRSSTRFACSFFELCFGMRLSLSVI